MDFIIAAEIAESENCDNPPNASVNKNEVCWSSNLCDSDSPFKLDNTGFSCKFYQLYATCLHLGSFTCICKFISSNDYELVNLICACLSSILLYLFLIKNIY